MLVCEAPELVRWTPDFSSSGGRKDPTWTKLILVRHPAGNGFCAGLKPS